MHPRKAIRAVATTRLSATPGIDGVYPVESARGLDLPHTELPRITVHTAGDQADEAGPRGVGPLQLMRTTPLVVSCCLAWTPASAATIGDELDDMAELVEAALSTAHLDRLGLGNLVQEFEYQGTEFTRSGDGQTVTVAAQLTYAVEFFSEIAATLPDVAGFDIDYYRMVDGAVAYPDGPHAQDVGDI